MAHVFWLKFRRTYTDRYTDVHLDKNEAMVSETHVTEKTYPDLKWVASPPGFSIPHEMYQSDAFTVLTKAEILVLMWVLSRREYPSKRELKKGKAKFNV